MVGSAFSSKGDLLSDPFSTDQAKIKDKSDLQGINYLVTDAIVSITRLVESLHHRINRVSGVSGHPSHEHTSGIPGKVYASVRGVAKLIGTAIDTPLATLNKVLRNEPNGPAIKALRSALNGILGDYLHSQKNPLAIKMHINFQGQPLTEEGIKKALNQAVINTDGKLLVMVHGLCMNDLQWSKDGHNHGEALAEELGMTPVYLTYNSGQHISQNGQELSDHLEYIFDKISAPLSIYFVTHSMGGLVTRSAMHSAQKAKRNWTEKVKKIVFLGTPHHGAPLEKTGNWLGILLGKHPYTAPFSKLVQLRSNGITDLRHGNVTDKDEQSRHPFDFVRDNRQVVPLPLGPTSYAIAGHAGTSSTLHNSELIGDGLVRTDSALGRHETREHTLRFKPEHQAVLKNINHMQLLSSKEVYDIIKDWLI